MALNSYQQAVVDWSVNGIGSAVVSALAGTGKTFTLEAIVSAVKAAKPEAEIFLGAYNKAIATELQTRMSKNDYGKSVQASTFHSAGLRALSSYLENVKGIKKLTITKGNDKVSGIIDGLRDQCIKAAARAQSDAKADGKRNVEDFITFVTNLFGDTKDGEVAKVLTLSTIHRSKGREWKKVYILGQNKYQPSKYAKKQWELDQEAHLFYVSVTRSMSELVFINV